MIIYPQKQHIQLMLKQDIILNQKKYQEINVQVHV